MPDSSLPPDDAHADACAGLQDALDRYLDGDATEAQREWVARRLAGQSRATALLAEFERQIKQPEGFNGTLNAERSLDSLHMKMADGGTRPSGGTLRLGQRTLRERMPSLPWRLISVVGIGTLLIAFGVISRRAVVSHSPAERFYTTTAGQRVTVALSDGSRVWLAPRSQLRVSSAFGTASRTVTLVGEAFFTVIHAQGIPFLVRTGHGTTRVLGTAFDVRRFAHDDTVRVAVISGKVLFASQRGMVTLTHGMLGEVADSALNVTSMSDMEAYTRWTEGELVFKRTPVPVMLATLGRWYGYDFRIASRDSVRVTSQHVTAAFKVAAPGEALEAIQRLLDVSATINGNIITLRQRHNTFVPMLRSTPDSFTHLSEVGR